MFKTSHFVGPIIGFLWGVTMALSITILLAFSTGAKVTPPLLLTGLIGALAAFVLIKKQPDRRTKTFCMTIVGFVCLLLTALRLGQPFGLILSSNTFAQFIALLSVGAFIIFPLNKFFDTITEGHLSRFEFEETIIRFLIGFGYVFFTAAVAIPFYVMVMTSLKSQQALMMNPLDFSLDFSQGTGLFRSYYELFAQFNFGGYLLTSFFVSVMTVLITLAVSIPGAYAVSRLRFKGRAALSRSVLLIYMVPMIVLALPIYIAFSMLGLRNSLFGLLMIYPVTTIPVALYMLQGYFCGLPAEVEEAGIMDGLSRVAVILKITLPLSLPAIASVSLYVFMIAWNEFLLAFMLLDNPDQFTLTRGVTMLNSSEIPRQHLMAGSVIATVPIMVIFLGLERFMTKGLTAGAVKG